MIDVMRLISLFKVGALPVLLSVLGCAAHVADAKDNDSEILYADPTVFAENGRYYLTGTRHDYPAGFALLESDDLLSWHAVEPDSMILLKGFSVYGDKGFWAPQILKDGGRYYFAYTANEQTAVAVSDGFPARFTQPEVMPVDGSEHNIDPFIFVDDDGRWYFYHVRFDNGNFLWVGEFDPVSGKIVEGTLRRCFGNDQPWEATPAYDSAPIMEGPTVVKLDGRYYLFYSANHFMSPDYAVGYAVSDSPLGPWMKNPGNPVIHRSIVGENGSGHGDIFTDSSGRMRYVYHVHNSDSAATPRRTRIVTLNLEKDASTGIYTITADPSSVIRIRRCAGPSPRNQ